MIVLLFDNLHELNRRTGYSRKILYESCRRSSIKDYLESLSIPHTEIGKIVVGGEEVNFSFIPDGNDTIDIYPFSKPDYYSAKTTLWPKVWSGFRFYVDANVKRVVRFLRMAGFDSLDLPSLSYRECGTLAEQNKRIIISRNLELLKCSTVYYGQLLRSQNHLNQLEEIVMRFGLYEKIQPFSRCMNCNSNLLSVDKKDVLDSLEPLTRKYYTSFKQCVSCRKIYWKGTHHKHMEQVIKGLLKNDHTGSE